MALKDLSHGQAISTQIFAKVHLEGQFLKKSEKRCFYQKSFIFDNCTPRHSNSVDLPRRLPGNSSAYRVYQLAIPSDHHKGHHVISRSL